MEQVAQWSAKMRHFVMAAYWQSRSTRSPLGSERPQGQGNVIPDRDLAEENRSHAEDVQRERPTDRRHGCRGDRHGELTGYTVNFVTVRQDSEFLIMSPADEMAKT